MDPRLEMETFSQYLRANRGVVLLAVIVALFLNFALRLWNIILSPTEIVLANYIFMINAAHIALLIFLILWFMSRFATAGELTGDQTNRMRLIASYLILSICALIAYRAIDVSIKNRGYTAFVQENAPLIELFEQYTQENGRPPQEMIDLYPIYTEQLEGTNWDTTLDTFNPEDPKIEFSAPFVSLDSESGRRVTYTYRDYSAEPHPDRPISWELTVSVYRGSFQSVKLIYNPEEIYEPSDKPIAEIGDGRVWAILGEY